MQHYQGEIPATDPVANLGAQQVLANVQAPGIQTGQNVLRVHVIEGEEELKAREALHTIGAVTDEELANSKLRLQAIENEQAAGAFPQAGAPVWFGPAIQAAIQAALQPIKDALQPIHAMTAKNWNTLAGDGLSRPWNIVPFANGTDPTLAPNYLPPLNSLDNIRALTGPQLTAYLQGYALGIQIPQQLDARRRLLAPLVGCFTVF